MSDRTRIALLGASGSMGVQIEAIAADYGAEIVGRYDHEHPLNAETLTGNPVVAIDFTRPDAVLQNVRTLVSLGLPMVVGTTGWESDRAEVEGLVREHGGRLLTASNFSVGVQTFARIVRAAARLVDRLDRYDVAMHEDHHVRKVDSPSGTALMLGEIVLEEMRRKERIEVERSDGKIDPAALHLSSRRVGEVIGTHQVTIDGLADTIELTHRARNRSGFAAGALLAAAWLPDQAPGLYRFDDLFEQITR